MRDDALIILNEREPLKQKKAEELQLALSATQISATRLAPSAETAKIIHQRQPKILVIDYLLGDFGTALEVLQSIADNKSATPIYSILWTDEPSVNVAVSALKLGAHDYLEIDAPRSVEKLIAAIDLGLQMQNSRGCHLAMGSSKKSIPSLVYHAQTSRNSLVQAEGLARRNQPIIVILGDPGCGRSSLAHYIHLNGTRGGSFFEFNLDTWAGNMQQVFGNKGNQKTIPMLSHSATVVFDHVDYDTGELLEAALENAPQIWPDRLDDSHPMLIVATSSPQTANAWLRLTDRAQCLEIAPLSERTEDFLPLLQGLAREVQSLGKFNELKLSHAVIRALSEQQWVGNIRQLRAAVLDALTTPLDHLLKIHQESAPDLENLTKELDEEQLVIIAAIVAAKNRWEHYHQSSNFVPQPLAARKALDQADKNPRIAAALLGCGVPQLRTALGTTSSEPQQEQPSK